MQFTVYRLVSPSGNCYVGQSRNDPKLRFRQHIVGWKKWIKDGRPRSEYQTKLYYAFDKYDPDTWELEVLMTTDDQDIMDQAEMDFISEFNAVEDGYNIMLGGQNGWAGKNLSEEHKNRIRDARLAYYETDEGKRWKQYLSEKEYPSGENHHAYGKPSWNRGAQVSEEERKRLGNISKAYWESEAGKAEKPVRAERFREIALRQKGVKWSEERKAAHPKSMLGKNQSDYQKQRVRETRQKTYIVTTPTGETLTVTNLSQWCKERGLDQGNMSRGGTKGYKTKRVDA